MIVLLSKKGIENPCQLQMGKEARVPHYASMSLCSREAAHFGQSSPSMWMHHRPPGFPNTNAMMSSKIFSA